MRIVQVREPSNSQATPSAVQRAQGRATSKKNHVPSVLEAALDAPAGFWGIHPETGEEMFFAYFQQESFAPTPKDAKLQTKPAAAKNKSPKKLTAQPQNAWAWQVDVEEGAPTFPTAGNPPPNHYSFARPPQRQPVHTGPASSRRKRGPASSSALAAVRNGNFLDLQDRKPYFRRGSDGQGMHGEGTWRRSSTYAEECHPDSESTEPSRRDSKHTVTIDLESLKAERYRTIFSQLDTDRDGLLDATWYTALASLPPGDAEHVLPVLAQVPALHWPMDLLAFSSLLDTKLFRSQHQPAEGGSGQEAARNEQDPHTPSISLKLPPGALTSRDDHPGRV